MTLGNDNGTDGQTDGQTDRRTDRVRRIMRPPPRDEGRIKSAQRDVSTARWLQCSKAEPKIFAALQTAFPAAQDGQNLISWRWSLPLPTDPVW